MRQAKASIVIRDMWDGINQDSELFIINGHIYKKLQLQKILELSVHAMIIKVKPDSNNQIKYTVKSDGVQNPDFYATFDDTYQVYNSSVNDIVTYTFQDNNIKTLYFTGRIGFELDPNCLLDDVVQWGDSNKMCYFSKFFKNFTKKSILAYDIPDLTYVSTLHQTFYNSYISFDMNALNTANIMNISQAYKYSVAPNLGFVFPTFKNVINIDEAFANVSDGAINWSGLKFLKLTSSINAFRNAQLVGNIINCEFGSNDILNVNYNAQKLFAQLVLNGQLSNNIINSSYVESLFDSANIKDLNIQSFTFRALSNANKMFYGLITKELKMSNCFSFKSFASTQEMFKLITVLGVFEFRDFTFGTSQYCSGMFESMDYSSALIYNIDFNGAVMDFIFKENIYTSVAKNIKISMINTSQCTSFVSVFENNDNILIHNPELINIDMKKATTVNSIFKGCKTFNFKNFYVTTSSFPEVINAEGMFENCYAMEANLINLRMPKLLYANRMLRNCYVFNQPLNLLNAVNLKQADYMLENCSSYNSATILSQNLESAIGMLKGCSSFNQNLDFDFTDLVETHAAELCMNCISFNPTNTIILDLSRCSDGTSLFNGCVSLNQSVNIATNIMTKFDTMFKSTMIGVGKIITLNTNNALTMKGIFAYTNNFGADLSSFYTPLVTDFSYICYSSNNFTSDLSVIETDNCINISYGFTNSNYNDTGIRYWNTTKILNYLSCFENSEYNQPLNWVTTVGSNYKNMFKGNNFFNQSMATFVFNEATTVENMFLNSLSFNQDMSDKRFNKCTVFDFMFYNAVAYAAHDMSSWLINSTENGISHIGFLKTANSNVEPVWR